VTVAAAPKAEGTRAARDEGHAPRTNRWRWGLAKAEKQALPRGRHGLEPAGQRLDASPTALPGLLVGREQGRPPEEAGCSSRWPGSFGYAQGGVGAPHKDNRIAHGAGR